MIKNEQMSEIAYGVYETLTNLLSLRQNIYKDITDNTYKDSIRQFCGWIVEKHPTIYSVTYQPQHSGGIPVLRLQTMTESRDIIFAGLEFCEHTFSLSELLKRLQLQNECFRGKPVYMAECTPVEEWYSRTCAEYAEKNPLITCSVIANELKTVLAEGMMRYADFGMFVLEQCIQENSYYVEVNDTNLLVSNMDIYAVHPSSSYPSLFTPKRVGDNGFDMIYDGCFIVECRFRDNGNHSEVVLSVRIVREDRKRMVF